MQTYLASAGGIGALPARVRTVSLVVKMLDGARPLEKRWEGHLPARVSCCRNPECAGNGFHVKTVLQEMLREGETRRSEYSFCEGSVDVVGTNGTRWCDARFRFELILAGS